MKNNKEEVNSEARVQSINDFIVDTYKNKEGE